MQKKCGIKNIKRNRCVFGHCENFRASGLKNKRATDNKKIAYEYWNSEENLTDYGNEKKDALVVHQSVIKILQKLPTSLQAIALCDFGLSPKLNNSLKRKCCIVVFDIQQNLSSMFAYVKSATPFQTRWRL